MLEVTILKVTHAGREEARKLLPYIKQADVYAPEEAAVTEELAQQYESSWEQVLSSGWSRTRFIKATEEKLRLFPPNIKDYILTERDYLYQRKVPIWSVERYQRQEAQRLREMKERQDLLHERALDSLARGNNNGFLTQLWDSLRLEKEITQIRDQHIADNLSTAEKRIRQRYTSLLALQPLQLTVHLGALHRPEMYLSIPVVTHDLRGEPQTLHDKLDCSLQQERPFEELRSLLLACGALELSQQKIYEQNSPE